MGSFIDLTGQKFGRLFVLEQDGYRGDSKVIMWKCKCDCGKIIRVAGMSLRTGHTTSCGCLKNERIKMLKYKHGENRTRLHNIWKAIHNRTHPNNIARENYYNRNITVCDEWSDYTNFAKWARQNGYNDDLTIDRIDVNGNYCPENCRWATYKQQANNKRNNVRITHNGVTKTLSEWSDCTGLAYSCLAYRYSRGYSEDKLFAPSLKNKKR